jgi:hypothetical protein
MKRISTLLTLFFLIGLLAGCGISLEKRQHTGGYYVNVNPRKHALKDDHTAVKPQEEATAEAPAIRTEPQPVEAEELVAEATVPGAIAEEYAAPAETPAAETRGIDARPTDEPVTAAEPERTSIVSKVADKLPVKTIKKVATRAGAGASGDALSLFWIVILILLVLWVAGLIGGGWGLGWVINVLLVIALVLLILWLLRIV